MHCIHNVNFSTDLTISMPRTVLNTDVNAETWLFELQLTNTRSDTWKHFCWSRHKHTATHDDEMKWKSWRNAKLSSNCVFSVSYVFGCTIQVQLTVLLSRWVTWLVVLLFCEWVDSVHTTYYTLTFSFSSNLQDNLTIAIDYDANCESQLKILSVFSLFVCSLMLCSVQDWLNHSYIGIFFIYSLNNSFIHKNVQKSR